MHHRINNYGWLRISSRNLKGTSKRFFFCDFDRKQCETGRNPKIRRCYYYYYYYWNDLKNFAILKFWYAIKLTRIESPNRIVEFWNSPNMILQVLHIKLYPQKGGLRCKKRRNSALQFPPKILVFFPTSIKKTGTLGIRCTKEDLHCKEKYF